MNHNLPMMSLQVSSAYALERLANNELHGEEVQPRQMKNK